MNDMNAGNPATRMFVEARDGLLALREDYAAARRFRWPALEHFNWAIDYFDVVARGNPATALWMVDAGGRDMRLSYEELSLRSSKAANFLRELGVRRGDRVLVMLPNHAALWELMLACMKIGAVAVPSTTLLSTDDLRDRIGRGEVRHLVAIARDHTRFPEAPSIVARVAVDGTAPGWTDYAGAQAAQPVFEPQGPTPADDPLLLYFTSGTTSKPKLVLHSHRSYPVGNLSTMYWLGLRPGDIHFNISSPGWAKHAWSCLFAPLTASATVFVHQTERFDAVAVLGELVRCRVTSLCAPPTVWRMLVQEDLASYPVALRELCGAGEPLNPEIIERVRRAWGITIRDGYGQTETTALIGNTPGQPVRPGSMGKPLPGYEIALLDADGQSAEEGEIAVCLSPRPAGVTMGYAGDPDRTAAALGGAYYRTGDVASRDADGYYTYVGRTDDVFKSSDYRISPFELESVLIEHPAVAEAAVVPSPDPVRLAVPKAFIVLCKGHQPSVELARDILVYARARLAPYKRVRRLEFHDLPKTISGKIRRVELRAREAGREPGGHQREPDEFWEEDLKL